MPRGNKASAGGLSRRPVQFWKPFNDWWRAELERCKRRPSAEQINCWHTQFAQTIWGDVGVPTMHDTRVHAKCLRSVDAVRHYFRKYREVKKTCQAGQEDDATDRDDDADDAPYTQAPAAVHVSPDLDQGTWDDNMPPLAFTCRQPRSKRQPMRHAALHRSANLKSCSLLLPCKSDEQARIQATMQPVQPMVQQLGTVNCCEAPTSFKQAYHQREMSIQRPPLSAAANSFAPKFVNQRPLPMSKSGLATAEVLNIPTTAALPQAMAGAVTKPSKQTCSSMVVGSQLGVPIANISRIKVTAKVPLPVASPLRMPASATKAAASPLGLFLSSFDDDSLETLDLIHLLSDTPTFTSPSPSRSSRWPADAALAAHHGCAYGKMAAEAGGPTNSQMTVDYSHQQPDSSRSHRWYDPSQHGVYPAQMQRHPAAVSGMAPLFHPEMLLQQPFAMPPGGFPPPPHPLSPMGQGTRGYPRNGTPRRGSAEKSRYGSVALEQQHHPRQHRQHSGNSHGMHDMNPAWPVFGMLPGTTPGAVTHRVDGAAKVEQRHMCWPGAAPNMF